MQDIKCPLCNTLIDSGTYLRESLKSQTYYDCVRCGKYSINDLVFDNINLDKISNLKAILSYWIRNNQNKNNLVYRLIFITLFVNFFFHSTYFIPTMLWMWFGSLGLAHNKDLM